MAKHPVEEIPLASIRTDGNTQARAATDETTARGYADVLVDGGKLPHGRVYRDAAGVNWLARGFHRKRAHELAELPAMACEVRPGGPRDALLDAIGDNADHGLPRTPADKRRAVELLLADDEWGRLSTVQIKEAATVSWDFADRIRKEWDSAHGGTPEKRTGADGREYAAQAPSRAGGSTEPDAADVAASPAREADGADGEAPASGTLDMTEGEKFLEDQYGQAVPPELFPVFEAAKTIRSLKNQLGKLVGEIDKVKAGPGGAKLSTSSVAKAGQDLQDALTRAIPTAVCPECAGQPKDCKSCDGQGWLWGARMQSLTVGQVRHLERFKRKAA
jgi:hypothetical protein